MTLVENGYTVGSSWSSRPAALSQARAISSSGPPAPARATWPTPSPAKPSSEATPHTWAQPTDRLVADLQAARANGTFSCRFARLRSGGPAGHRRRGGHDRSLQAADNLYELVHEHDGSLSSSRTTSGYLNRGESTGAGRIADSSPEAASPSDLPCQPVAEAPRTRRRAVGRPWGRSPDFSEEGGARIPLLQPESPRSEGGSNEGRRPSLVRWRWCQQAAPHPTENARSSCRDAGCRLARRGLSPGPQLPGVPPCEASRTRRRARDCVPRWGRPPRPAARDQRGRRPPGRPATIRNIHNDFPLWQPRVGGVRRRCAGSRRGGSALGP